MTSASNGISQFCSTRPAVAACCSNSSRRLDAGVRAHRCSRPRRSTGRRSPARCRRGSRRGAASTQARSSSAICRAGAELPLDQVERVHAGHRGQVLRPRSQLPAELGAAREVLDRLVGSPARGPRSAVAPRWSRHRISRRSRTPDVGDLGPRCRGRPGSPGGPRRTGPARLRLVGAARGWPRTPRPAGRRRRDDGRRRSSPPGDRAGASATMASATRPCSRVRCVVEQQAVRGLGDAGRAGTGSASRASVERGRPGPGTAGRPAGPGGRRRRPARTDGQHSPRRPPGRRRRARRPPSGRRRARRAAPAAVRSG